MKPNLRFTVLVAASALFVACPTSSPKGDGGPPPGDGGSGDGGTAKPPVIASARIVVAERKRIEMEGDLWVNAWAANGNAYFLWGDGTGQGPCYPAAEGTPPGCVNVDRATCNDPGSPVVFCDDFCGIYPCDGSTCYDPCIITSMGIFEQEGPIATFQGCGTDCIQTLHVPDGVPQFVYGQDPGIGNKPTGLLALGDTLVLAGHRHEGADTVLEGYIAVSNDLGFTWTVAPGSPWTGDSHFKRMMLIDFGKGYALNEDGWVYGIGMGPPDVGMSDLYLARAPVERVAEYTAYQYYAGPTRGWDPDPEAAVPLGPKASFQGDAIYHPGIDRYLLLIPGRDYVIELWEAPDPTGPWTLAQRFEGEAYAPSIIAKDAGPTSFYFTAAGGSGVGDTYQLNINRIELTLR
ncbi:MAG: DUF4185 domain-containing protein [Deltaproteobacteria bacterium]|nr:MAG: DUF4185 domain-containing protein [Deltaproteobacteria bacterium]